MWIRNTSYADMAKTTLTQLFNDNVDVRNALISQLVVELVDRPAEFLLHLRRRRNPQVTNKFSAPDELDPLSRPHPAGRHGVERGLEGDQRVLADPAQVGSGDQIWHRRQPTQGRPVGHRPLADDLPGGAVQAGPSTRQPGGEGVLDLGEGGKGPAGEHMLAHDEHLALHPALPGRPVGGQHVDDEAVVLGEGARPSAAAPPLRERRGGGPRS